MSITATVENNTIKLPPGVHLPDGTEVSIESKTPPRSSKPWMELAGCLAHELEELDRIDRVVEEEFGRINPEDWR